jgi:hypothetical protein
MDTAKEFTVTHIRLTAPWTKRIEICAGDCWYNEDAFDARFVSLAPCGNPALAESDYLQGLRDGKRQQESAMSELREKLAESEKREGRARELLELIRTRLHRPAYATAWLVVADDIHAFLAQPQAEARKHGCTHCGHVSPCPYQEDKYLECREDCPHWTLCKPSAEKNTAKATSETPDVKRMTNAELADIAHSSRTQYLEDVEATRAEIMRRLDMLANLSRAVVSIADCDMNTCSNHMGSELMHVGIDLADLRRMAEVEL